MRKLKSNIDSISEYEAGLDIDFVKQKYKVRRVIKLASNENPYPLPYRILKKIKKFLRNINRYPDMHYSELKKNIAKKENLLVEEILPGNGSDEILELFFKCFIKKGDRVLIFSPSFSYYKILTEIYKAKVVLVKLRNFRFDINEILKKIKEVKVIILCNPNNPTGTYLNKKDLTFLIEKLKKNQFLCIDEAYYNFADSNDFPDSVSLFNKYKKGKNILITRTFSKLYGLAGLRIGYGIANKDIIKLLNKLRAPFNVNYIAMQTVKYLLKDKKYVQKIKKKILDVKYFFYEELKELNLFFIPSQTNFVLVKFPFSGEMVFNYLLSNGIIIRIFNSKELKDYARITIGKKGEMKILVKYLKKILKRKGFL